MNGFGESNVRDLTGIRWSEEDIERVMRFRQDNPNLSQRELARLILPEFPGRSFLSVYHRIRRVDTVLRSLATV